MLRSAANLDLREAWDDLRRAVPNVGHRAGAAALGVTEAELVATGCGDTAIRLTADWRSLLTALRGLGSVVAITRNARAVQEKIGLYDNVHVAGPVGLVLGDQIDLRLFLEHWRMAFAVRDGRHEGIHFFDGDGSGVHAVLLDAGSDRAAFRALVDRHTSRDQSTRQAVYPKTSAAAERPDAVVDVAGLRAAWSAMQDTFEFTDLLRRYQVTREQALRLAGPAFAHRVPRGSVRELLTWVAAASTPLMIYVSNPGTVHIHSGALHRVAVVGRWLTARNDRFRLQLRTDRVASAWVVRKPTRDGLVSSLELFDRTGETIALLFGERKPGFTEPPAWHAALSRLPTVAPR